MLLREKYVEEEKNLRLFPSEKNAVGNLTR